MISALSSTLRHQAQLNCARSKLPTLKNNRGAILIVTLVLLLIIFMLGMSMNNIVSMDKKIIANRIDYQIAFQSAQLALDDAETDIDASLNNHLSRSTLFSPVSSKGFNAPCQQGTHNRYQGLCYAIVTTTAPANTTKLTSIPMWKNSHIERDDDQSISIAYGRFTGQTIPTGGRLTAKLPRYMIELILDPLPNTIYPASHSSTSYLYRITAIGFGNNPKSHVVLQTIYRKAMPTLTPNIPYGRISWKEIINWVELRNAS